MVGRGICDKLPWCIFENFEKPEWNEGNFKIVKDHEGDLFQKLPEPNMSLLVNHTKPKKHFVLKLIYLTAGNYNYK